MGVVGIEGERGGYRVVRFGGSAGINRVALGIGNGNTVWVATYFVLKVAKKRIVLCIRVLVKSFRLVLWRGPLGRTRLRKSVTASIAGKLNRVC